jgi:PhzF family phenazine biosynthesis protein
MNIATPAPAPAVDARRLRIPIYQIDAFADRPFSGNPAAVCPLEHWLPDAVLQSIAEENNLAQTAFYVPRALRTAEPAFDLRWFTPAAEVDICGHATLASAYFILGRSTAESVAFYTRSGVLRVTRDGARLALDFPARPPAPQAADTAAIEDALGARPAAVLKSRDVFAVFDNAAAVAGLKPDMAKVAALDGFGVIATAPGIDCDFVSRFFVPKVGVPEDPVTGSAHCSLIPYWAERLGKTDLFARQISKRGGQLWCRHRGDRVTIAGTCAPYLEGWIEL